MDPRNTPIPISKQDGFWADLAKRVGLYRPSGADKPLNEGRLDEAAFLSTRASSCRTRPTCRPASTTATAWAGRTPWA